ncbi:hypothetical protein AURDEDRAFT_186471 [Auricularia subglabra TFB-10046 SS5]|nr:hypothetical protein AURDEDRAFT_186471 [Auricularia subglabra TFB-10046 SS5]
MAFNNRYPPSQRVAAWDPARPSGVIVDPTAPSYLPIPKRLPATSPPAAVLDLAMTANLIVTANSSTYVQDGPVKDELTNKLGDHRADVESTRAKVQTAKYKERGCWDILKLRSEAVDPLRDDHRRHARNLYKEVEGLAANDFKCQPVPAEEHFFPTPNLPRPI